MAVMRTRASSGRAPTPEKAGGSTSSYQTLSFLLDCTLKRSNRLLKINFYEGQLFKREWRHRVLPNCRYSPAAQEYCIIHFYYLASVPAVVLSWRSLKPTRLNGLLDFLS